MARDREEQEAILAESRSAMEVLQRLIGRLEAFTERLETETQRVGKEANDGRT